MESIASPILENGWVRCGRRARPTVAALQGFAGGYRRWGARPILDPPPPDPRPPVYGRALGDPRARPTVAALQFDYNEVVWHGELLDITLSNRGTGYGCRAMNVDRGPMRGMT